MKRVEPSEQGAATEFSVKSTMVAKWLVTACVTFSMSPGFASAAEPVGAADPAGFEAAHSGAAAAGEAEIQALEAKWLEAEMHGDVDFLDRLLAPGYQVLTAKTGAVRTKAQLLAQVAKNAGKTGAVPPLATRVIQNGDTSTAYSVMSGTKASGEPFQASYVDVYQRLDGRWVAVTGVDF